MITEVQSAAAYVDSIGDLATEKFDVASRDNMALITRRKTATNSDVAAVFAVPTYDLGVRNDAEVNTIDVANERNNVPMNVDVETIAHVDTVCGDMNAVGSNMIFGQQNNSKVQTAPTGIFVGSIPLQVCSNSIGDDKIAEAFNNSSRKTLSYIPPTIQNGEVVVRPTIEVIRNGSTKWKTTAVGYFLGKRLYFYHVKNLPSPFGLDCGRLKPQRMDSSSSSSRLMHIWKKQLKVPVWIKLRHLPVELWTEEGLSTVASGIGKPLYSDVITRACTRLDFARVCVMLDVSSKLPKHIIILTPDEEGGETPCKIDVEYEWIPPKCTTCITLGHSAKDYVINKTSKPAKLQVTVYIPKTGPARLSPVHDHEEIIPPSQGVDNQRDEHDASRASVNLSREEKVWNVRGLNKRNHQLAVKDIVAEFRRELWGSLETIATQSVDILWLIGGDFNTVRDLSEICGASGDIRMAMEEFNGCVQNAGLLPLPMQGEWYTWHNCSANPRNLWKRLDRLLINDRWMARFPTSFYTSLTPRTSDHSPLVLNGDSQQQYGDMFRFDNYLILSPKFIPSVQRIWQHTIIGVPMYAVTKKLKILKPVFREQRRKKGDLSHNV
ncbi:UNVERIFIED_CONTAM: hypothetical protein Sindi_1274300 [Sesamum indicum]